MTSSRRKRKGFIHSIVPLLSQHFKSKTPSLPPFAIGMSNPNPSERFCSCLTRWDGRRLVQAIRSTSPVIFIVFPQMAWLCSVTTWHWCDIMKPSYEAFLFNFLCQSTIASFLNSCESLWLVLWSNDKAYSHLPWCSTKTVCCEWLSNVTSWHPTDVINKICNLVGTYHYKNYTLRVVQMLRYGYWINVYCTFQISKLCIPPH